MADAEGIQGGIEIRKPKKQRNIQNDERIKSCIERYDNGAYVLPAAASADNQPQSGCSHRGFPGDAQWLKWFCEAGGSPDEARLEQTPYHSNPTNLALFGHK